MKVTVRNLAGTSYDFDVDASTKVEIFMTQVALTNLVEGSIKRMRLVIMNGNRHTILDNKTALSHYNIQDGEEITVVVRNEFKEKFAIGKRINPHILSEPNDLRQPAGLCGSSTELFVVDKLSNSIKVYDTSNGKFLRTYDGKRETNDRYIPTVTFREPQGICLSQDGKELFVADTGNQCIVVMDAQTGTIIDIISLKYNPKEIYIAEDNKLFITDSANYIRVYESSQSGGAYRKRTRRTLRKRR